MEVVWFTFMGLSFLSARGGFKIDCEAVPSERAVECKCGHWSEAGTMISG